MRIAVIGGGGVGGYFGGRLALTGEDVTFIARGEHLRAIQESGLRVESAGGDFIVQPAQATDDSAQVGPVEVVLVAVKGWQLLEAIETMRPLVGPETLVVSLLNGVEASDLLAAAFGQSRVAGGLCGVLAWIVGPGRIRNVSPHPVVTIGELDNATTERIERLYTAFVRSGADTTLAVDIQAALWEKLALVGPFAGLAAVARVPVGALRTVPETRTLLAKGIAEVVQLARARGVAAADDTVAMTLAILDGMPEGATASMQRDVMAGRPSELETQVGVVVRLASAADLAVPIHTFLYACLLPQERRARGEEDGARGTTGLFTQSASVS